MLEPYKPLFLIGFVHALVGSLSWTLAAHQWIRYPISLHANWMIYGFLLSFSVGFLMTAIPRFFNAPTASSLEVWSAFFFSVLSLISNWSSPSWAGTIALFQLSGLFIFAIRRFLNRSFSPPPSFIFLPMGILFGIVGSFFMIQSPLAPQRVLAYEGMILCFIFGIGAKLITSLLGYCKPIVIGLGKERTPLFADKFLIIEAIVMLLGGITHALNMTLLGDALWLAVGISISTRLWKFYKWPTASTLLVKFIWLSIQSLLFGLLLVVVLPHERIHWIHLVYISGMGLLTIMIATRVILAHGGYSLEIERKSKALLVVGLLFLLAAITRVLAPKLGSQNYLSHLSYAGFTFFIGLMLWGGVFLFKTLKSSLSRQDH